MNRGQLRTYALQLLDDPDGGYFSSSTMNDWLNRSQIEVQKWLVLAGENNFLKCVQTDLVVDQCNYSLPSDFLKVNRLEIVTSGTGVNEVVHRVAPITENEKDIIWNPTGTPLGYWLKKNSLILRPIPDAVLTLRLSYHYRVADMSADTESPDFPEEYHELCALYAARRGFIKDDRQNGNVEGAIAQFESLMKSMSNERRVDESRSIVTTKDDEVFWGF